MTPLSICFLIAFVTYLTLLVMIVTRNPRSSLNLVGALILLALAAWSFEDIFHNNSSLSVERLRYFERFGTLGWTGFASLLVLFVLIVTHRRRWLRSWFIYPALLAVPALFSYLQFTGWMVIGYEPHHFGWVAVWSRSAWPIVYYLSYFLLTGLAIGLLIRYRQTTASSRERRQTLVLLCTLIIPVVLGSITDAILPRFTVIRLPELAGVFGLVWAGGLYYSATRHGLTVFSPYAAADEILTTMADSLLLLAPDNRIVNVNRAIQDLLGYRKSELVGRPAEMLFALPGQFRDEARQVNGGHEIRQQELTALARNSREVPVSISARLLRDTDGMPLGSVWVLHDMTMHRRSEEEILGLAQGLAALNDLAVELAAAPPDLDIYGLLAERLKAVSGADVVGTGEYLPDRQEIRIRRLVLKSDLLARVNELLGRNILELRMPVAPDVYARIVQDTVAVAGNLSQATFGAVPPAISDRILKLLGISTFTSLSFTHHGELLGTALVSSRAGHPLPPPDILRAFANIAAVYLHRRQLESALRDSEELYRNVVERANDGIVIIQDQIVKFANRRLREMWGDAKADLTGTSFLDYIDPDEQPRVAERYNLRFAGQPVAATYETVLRRRDGSPLYVELNAGVIHYQGQPADLVIVRDTGERRRNAAALRDSEENFRTLAENARDGILIIGADGRCLYANQEAARITGHRTAELRQTHFRDLVAPDVLPAVQANFARRLQGETLPAAYETAGLRKDGTRAALDVTVARTVWQAQPAVLVAMRDVTERKQAEAELLALRDRLEEQVRARTAELTRANRQLEQEIEEHRRIEERLRESETRFHGVFEKAPIGMCLTGPDGRFLDVNQALCRMLEYTHAELAATGFGAVTHPADLPASRECVRALLAGEQETYRFEKRYLKKSGGAVWADVSTILLRAPDGTPLYFITHILEIPGRRRPGKSEGAT